MGPSQASKILGVTGMTLIGVCLLLLLLNIWGGDTRWQRTAMVVLIGGVMAALGGAHFKAADAKRIVNEELAAKRDREYELMVRTARRWLEQRAEEQQHQRMEAGQKRWAGYIHGERGEQ